MSDTPETDAFFFRTDIDWDMEVDFARRLERERDEALEECAKWHGMAIEADKRFVESVLVRDEESKKSRRLANEAIATWQKIRDERDALQEQLDAATMLGKLQERRHERELEQVREQYRLSSVCRKLLLENQQLKESRQSPTTNQ